MWPTILSALLSVLASKLPTWLMAIVKSWLGKLVPPTNAKNLSFAAPDQLKAWVKSFLDTELAKIHLPFVKLILTKVVEMIEGPILDEIWNLVFPDQAIALPKMAVAQVDWNSMVDAECAS